MAYDRDKYAAVLAYLPREMKARMDRIKQHDRRYSFTRLLEESLADFLPKIEAKFGIKSHKAKPKEA